MEYDGKTKSPYYGVLGSCALLIGFTVGMILFFSVIFHDLANEERKYCSLAFGSLIGSIFSLGCCVAGLLKGTFKVVKNRFKEFFENLSVSFKFAIKYYWENIKREGIVFWILFPIICANIGLTIYSFMKYFEFFVN